MDDMGCRAHKSFGNDNNFNANLWDILFDKEGEKVLSPLNFKLPNPDRTNPFRSLNGFHVPYYHQSIIEVALKVLLENGGSVTNLFDYIEPLPQPMDVFLSQGGSYATVMTITDIDPVAGLVVVSMTNKTVITNPRPYQYGHNVSHCALTFRTDAETRIIAGESNLEMGHVALSNLVVGSQVYVDFSVTEEDLIAPRESFSMETVLTKGKDFRRTYAELDTQKLDGRTFLAHRISAFTGVGSAAYSRFDSHRVKDQMTFWGTIIDMNPDQKTIEVEMEKGSLEKCTGYRFWEKYKDVAAYEGQASHWLNPKIKMTALRRWVTGGPEARRYRFKIDRSVRIFRNGKPGKGFSDLQPGDRVSVFYMPAYELQQQGSGLIYPENILASSRKDVK